MKIENALNMFKENKVGSFKLQNNTVLVVTPNAMALRYYDEGYRDSTVKQDILAARIGVIVIGNSSALEYARRLDRRGVVTDEQLYLSEQVPMIPFTVLKQAELNINTYREIDCGESETLLRRESRTRLLESQLDELESDSNVVQLTKEKAESDSYGERKGHKRWNVSFMRKQHFAGARLFEVNNKRFLLDVDRVELKHGIINPFLVELQSATVSTVAEAYESLKPVDVKVAEQQGKTVKRQGEWFFIPVSEFEAKRCQKLADKRIAEVKASGENRFGIERANRGVLRAGRNRPNNVDTMIEIDGDFFVKGTVSHSGREHKDMTLKGFHRAVPNTSQTSWTIEGDID